MNIFISANDRYIYPAQVMLTSFFHHNSDEKHSVYFMYSSVTADNIQKLDNIVRKKGSCFVPVRITEAEFDEFKRTDRFTVETYYRFLISKILPRDEKRALWLDVDLVINKSLTDFYYQHFSNCEMIACKSIGDHSEILTALGCALNTDYVNAGVILFNMDGMRKYTLSDFQKYYLENEKAIVWFDQDILNGMFAGQIKVLGNEMYNVQVLNGRFPPRQDVMALADRAAIVHFIGHYKPWQKEYTNPCAEIWDHYHAIAFDRGNGYILWRRFERWMKRRIWIPFRNLRGNLYNRVGILKWVRDMMR